MKIPSKWSANYRHVGFALFSALLCAVFYPSLKDLFALLRANEIYSHIMVVPFVSAYMVYLERREILSHAKYAYKAGIVLVIVGGLIHLTTEWVGSSQNDLFSINMFSALVILTGGFVSFYGLRAFRVALFPMLFLFLMIPLPDVVVDVYTSFLQRASAEVVNGLFTILHLPAVRLGEHTFALPNLTFEVARQCSGIRSSIALFLISIFVGKLFLRKGWNRTILAVSVIPITIIKNGLRIFTIVTLGSYWDPRILEGDLHRSGGIPFLFLALLFMAPIFLLLRRSERKKMELRTE
jgi:exosortase